MTQLKMSRRSFLKLSAATAAAAGALSALPSGFAAAAEDAEEKSGAIKRVRTGCRGCGKMECGVIVAGARWQGDSPRGRPHGVPVDGQLLHQEPVRRPGGLSSGSPALPAEAQQRQRVDDDPGWVRISWDEAISTVVSKFNELQAKYGGESLFGMCGTSRVWCMFGASNGMYLWDSPNIVQAWQICKGPRHFATMMVSSFTDSWMETVGHPDVYVAVGRRFGALQLR